MNIEKIIDIFPHPIIGKVKGKPDREQIKKIEKKIQENAASVQSTLGGGNHGHLGLTMTDTDYKAAIGT